MFYPPTAPELKAVMRQKGYTVFGGGQQPYDLNLFGVRTKDMQANTFNDWIGVMYLLEGVWSMFAFPGTTDPGTYWRKHPMNVAGTALLKPGQYRGAFKVGVHKDYSALQQNSELPVYRDADRDDVLFTDEHSVQKGMFGINLHRASATHPSLKVDKWSAGCQVLQDPMHFAFLMALCKRAANIWGNSFTYTLLTESDF